MDSSLLSACMNPTDSYFYHPVSILFKVHFIWVHRYDFITGKRADIRRGDSWGWGFFHERLIRPYIYVDETIGVGNKKQTRPIVVRCPQRRSL